MTGSFILGKQSEGTVQRKKQHAREKPGAWGVHVRIIKLTPCAGTYHRSHPWVG